LTFNKRGTALPEIVEAFEQTFVSAKQVQWEAFWKRLQRENVPETFSDVVSGVEEFLAPLVPALAQGYSKAMRWTASGPWS
jgi:hypothetical protein